jgi:hypothetical protein
MLTGAEELVADAIEKIWKRGVVSRADRKVVIGQGLYVTELVWREAAGAMFFTLTYFECRAGGEGDPYLRALPGDFSACFELGAGWVWDEVVMRLFVVRTPPIANPEFVSLSA